MSNILELNPLRAPVRLSAPEGYRAVSTAIGTHGEAIRLYVPARAADAVFGTHEQTGWAIFPKTHTEQSYPAKISITTAEVATLRELPPQAATYPLVQTLPGDNFLVVASRCRRWSDGTHELNASVYRLDGSLETQFCLGDGIEHVQADSAGRLWVGYFDEGIFGNFGWGTNADTPPIGVAGLVCFDSHGKKLWEFEEPQGFDSIADCYALNVADGEVWACYYDEFPVVRLDSRHRIAAWATDLSGPRALAVYGNFVLAYGGYEDQATDCKLLRLGDGRAEVAAEVALHLPQGLDLKTSTVIGRGSMLHVFAADEWYVFGVASLPQSQISQT